MPLLQVLKVSVAATAPATGTKDYYFQGGYVYKDSAVAAATGISVVANFENDEPLIKIEQMILSKKIMRLKCEVEGTQTTAGGTKKRKVYDIYVARDKAAAILGGNSLNGKSFKVKTGNTENVLGTIKDVRTSTRDSFQ
jgi:hypothetical protein